MDAAFELDDATNKYFAIYLKKKNTEYCFMSQALDFIVQTGPKVEGYFYFISQLSTDVLGLDFCILFFQITAFFHLQLFLLK